MEQSELEERKRASPVEVKPTWTLAWGLWWRMAVISGVIAGIVFLAQTCIAQY